jgi:hypothetical protein
MAGRPTGRIPAARPCETGLWMMCQYLRPDLVSSEKHQVTPGLRVEGRGGPTSMGGTRTMGWAATILGLCDWRSAADSLSSANH